MRIYFFALGLSLAVPLSLLLIPVRLKSGLRECLSTTAGQIVQLITQIVDPLQRETWEGIYVMKANLGVLTALSWAASNRLLFDFVIRHVSRD